MAGPGKTRLYALLAATLAGFSVPALAQDIVPGTAWHEAQVSLLDVDFPDTGFHARWEFFHCGCGDVLIRLEQSAPDGVLTGELVLVEGRVVLARGLVGQGADLEMMLQAPTLMLQLTLGLMQRAIPGGPAVVVAEREIEVREERADVTIDTGVADGRFAAPWTLTGRAWATAATRRRFDLVFEFSTPGANPSGGELKLTGGQDFGADHYPLADETPLEGWRLQRIAVDPDEPAEPPAAQTLGELRASLQ